MEAAEREGEQVKPIQLKSPPRCDRRQVAADRPSRRADRDEQKTAHAIQHFGEIAANGLADDCPIRPHS